MKLLSEEALIEELFKITTNESSRFSIVLDLPKLMALINSQKIAWANHVIGPDIECDGTCRDGVHEGQKELLIYQRERNTL